jgi:hypothetical protein
MPRAVVLLKLTRVAGLAGIVADIAIRCRCGSQLLLTPHSGGCFAFINPRGTRRNREQNGGQNRPNHKTYPGHHFRRVYRRKGFDIVWMKAL